MWTELSCCFGNKSKATVCSLYAAFFFCVFVFVCLFFSLLSQHGFMAFMSLTYVKLLVHGLLTTLTACSILYLDTPSSTQYMSTELIHWSKSELMQSHNQMRKKTEDCETCEWENIPPSACFLSKWFIGNTAYFSFFLGLTFFCSSSWRHVDADEHRWHRWHKSLDNDMQVTALLPHLITRR